MVNHDHAPERDFLRDLGTRSVLGQRLQDAVFRSKFSACHHLGRTGTLTARPAFGSRLRGWHHYIVDWRAPPATSPKHRRTHRFNVGAMKQLSHIVWNEGMHLAQHHFQAQSRFFEDTVQFALTSLFFKPYGIVACELDADTLMNDSVSLIHARGVMPDGLPFDIPSGDAPVAPLADSRPVLADVGQPSRAARDSGLSAGSAQLRDERRARATRRRPRATPRNPPSFATT